MMNIHQAVADGIKSAIIAKKVYRIGLVDSKASAAIVADIESAGFVVQPIKRGGGRTTYLCAVKR